MSGSMKVQHSNTSYEPNSEMDMSGRFVPQVDLTDDDDDADSHMSDIPLQLPASAHVSSNNSALVPFSQAGGDLMQHDHSLHPIPNQTGANRWQLQYPVAYPQCVPADPGRQETAQLVTQRERKAQNDQRETARSALSHQLGELLVASHQYEAAARKNLVSKLARNSEAHTFLMCRWKFDSSIKKQNEGNCYHDFLRRKGSQSRHEEWEDDSKVVWSEVTGLCAFWDGRCRDDVRGAGMLFKIFTQTPWWYTIYKKCAGQCPAGTLSMLSSLAVPCWSKIRKMVEVRS